MEKACCLLLAILLLASGAGAESVAQLQPTNYVNDFAHILDAPTAAQLNALCLEVDQKTHAQISVVTINSLDGSDIESFTSALFKKWGIGDKSTKRGVLIVLAVKDRRYRTEVGYGLEPILPDGRVGSFGRNSVPYLRNGDFNGAVALITTSVANAIADDAGVKLDAGQPPPDPDAQVRPGSHPVLPLIALAILALFVIFTPFGRALLFAFLFSGGSRGGGGWGGGGFGGGGGGFGGFGGGSSGGGGASGRW